MPTLQHSLCSIELLPQHSPGVLLPAVFRRVLFHSIDAVSYNMVSEHPKQHHLLMRLLALLL